MTNYEKIKKACQIANPKLMDLSFGSQILYGEDHEFPALFINWVSKTENEIAVLCCTFGNRKILDREWIKILGHEPQLSDVLMALHHQKVEMKVEIEVLSGGRFKFWKEDYNKFGDFEETNTYFDLSKSVKDQSPETLQFIADLL
jgi:hypothetical protein